MSNAALTECDARARLENAASDLLADTPDGKSLRQTTEEFYSLLADISGLNDNSKSAQDSSPIILPSGKAIAPLDAARSLLDHNRTAKYLRGANAAIQRRQLTASGRPLEILYAGCGPFAPFALLLATRFSPDQVQFTLLDIHPRSLEIASDIFRRVGLAAHVRDFICADAALYRSHRSFDLEIIEAMQKALAHEPQVAIARNVVPQLSTGGFLVPEKIVIDAYLSDPIEALKQTVQRTYLGQVFELSAASIDAAETLAPAIVEVPRDLEPQFLVSLVTRIKVFDDIELREYESGLTYPTFLHYLGFVRPSAKLEFTYEIGTQPGLRCRIVGE